MSCWTWDINHAGSANHNEKPGIDQLVDRFCKHDKSDIEGNRIFFAEDSRNLHFVIGKNP